MKVCSFCSAKIDEGKSVCSDCMNKYGINAMISLEDGCSCDTK